MAVWRYEKPLRRLYLAPCFSIISCSVSFAISSLLSSYLLDVAGTRDLFFYSSSEGVELALILQYNRYLQRRRRNGTCMQLVRVQEMKVPSAAPDQVSRARITAASAPHSGAFLHVRPCSSLGTRLDNSSLPKLLWRFDLVRRSEHLTCVFVRAI